MTRASITAGALLLGLLPVVLPVATATPSAAGPTLNEAVHASDPDGDGVAALVLRELGSGRVREVLPPDTERGSDYIGAQLSPDGRRIALTTNLGSTTVGGESVFAVAVVERDGGGFTRVTAPPRGPGRTEDLFPTWSPDGRTLAFSRITVSAEGSVDTQVRTVGADETLAAGTPVAGAENGFTADWDPTGAGLVFSDVNPSDAAQGRLTNGTLTTVRAGERTSLGVTGALPAWSPDGRTIAYTTVTEADPDRARAADIEQIALVTVDDDPYDAVRTHDGRGTVLAATRPGPERTSAAFPSWSPDGESLLYELWAYDDEGTPLLGDLWAVDRTGERAGRITRTTADERGVHLLGPAPAVVRASVPSSFTPVTPKRILDASAGPGDVRLPLDGIVPTAATAVLLNLTALDASADTDLRVFAADRPVPGVGNLRVAAGRPAAGPVTVALGSGGDVLLRTATGTVRVIAEVAGWYTPGDAGSGITAVTPQPLLDARLRAGSTVDLQVARPRSARPDPRWPVPQDATAVVVAVSARGAAGSAARAGVQLYPAGAGVPDLSRLYLQGGEPSVVLTTVPVGRGGRVRLRTAGARLTVTATLVAYYAPSSRGRFVAVQPTAFLDTRDGTGAAPIPLAPGQYVDMAVAGTRGVPAGAPAALLDVTAIAAGPAGSAGATVAGLTVPAGGAASVLVRTTGRVRLGVDTGSAHVVAQLAGYLV